MSLSMTHQRATQKVPLLTASEPQPCSSPTAPPPESTVTTSAQTDGQRPGPAAQLALEDMVVGAGGGVVQLFSEQCGAWAAGQRVRPGGPGMCHVMRVLWPFSCLRPMDTPERKERFLSETLDAPDVAPSPEGG